MTSERERLFALKKPAKSEGDGHGELPLAYNGVPIPSHDYKPRKKDKRNADKQVPRYSIEMSEAEMGHVWKRIPPEEKRKLLNDWLAGRW